MGNDYRVSAAAVARAMTRNTVLVVASSPCFPHGVIDDVSGISAVRPVPCHVSFTYMHPFWKTVSAQQGWAHTALRVRR